MVLVEKQHRMSKDVDGNGKSDIVGFGDYGVWVTNSIF
jgi:hypothetical protein